MATNLSHYFRRFIHLNMAWIPLLYYFIWQNSLFNFTKEFWICIVCLFFISLEFIRLNKSILIFGLRAYEKTQISAFTWGIFAITLTLYFAPHDGIAGSAIGFPLIATLSLVDPWLGEIKHFVRYTKNSPSKNQYFVFLKIFASGLVLAYLIWFLCYLILQTPLWMVFTMPILMVLAEQIKISWIDDNATMLLWPLLVIKLVFIFLYL